ncbi:PepSY domain-containing protein [Bradyrhizobium genosp. A]|uniref:PepSY domain-containing protein n=1 Tax=Bradyrhizobium genosp. A TaxID=83626 RepID=UPI003CF96896
MFVKKAAELVLLLVVSTVSTFTLARASSSDTSPTSTEQSRDAEWAVNFQEIEVFADAHISVQNAIEIVEKRAIGAKAVAASFDGGPERLAYKVKAYRHGQIWQGTVDASTGEIREEIERPISALDAKDKVELVDFRAAGINLSDAVAIAENCGEGKAVSAGLEHENGRLIFLVVLVADGTLKQISVDPGRKRNRPRSAPAGKRNFHSGEIDPHIVAKHPMGSAAHHSYQPDSSHS